MYMLKIRLRRMGSAHRPYYRVVVSDSRKFPTASALEEVGHYDPRSEPEVIKIDADRVEHWVDKGARMSPTVKKLLKRQSASAA
jgi:small subunit ribosomal protein S16